MDVHMLHLRAGIWLQNENNQDMGSFSMCRFYVFVHIWGLILHK